MRGAACIAIAVLAGATGYVRSAAAACAANDITGINCTSTSLAPYNPFTPFAPKVVSVTVSALRACGLELAFLSTSSPPRMIGFGSLNYDIQLASSAVSLVYTGGMPVTTAHIDIGPGNIGSTNVQIVASTAQAAAASNSLNFTITDLPTSSFPSGAVTDTLLGDAIVLVVKAQSDLAALRTATEGAIAAPGLEAQIQQIIMITFAAKRRDRAIRRRNFSVRGHGPPF